MGGEIKVVVLSAGLLDALDFTEYDALSDANKEVVKIFLSCGSINIATGSKVRAVLGAIFPPGTATDTAIKSMVGIPPEG